MEGLATDLEQELGQRSSKYLGSERSKVMTPGLLHCKQLVLSS